jgi:pSer/pThr/pTyr-binding forkhead associated (FHA) protein
MSPVHARLLVSGEGATLEDLQSLNGTFVRLRRPVAIGPGDTFVVGRQLLRLEAVGRTQASTVGKDGTRLLGSPPPEGEFVLVQLSASGRVQDRYHLPAGGAAIGRELGDVRFPGDRYASGRHAQLAFVRGRATLTDVGSSNGTWLRVRKPTPLARGDEIYLGSQVFRLI